MKQTLVVSDFILYVSIDSAIASQNLLESADERTVVIAVVQRMNQALFLNFVLTEKMSVKKFTIIRSCNVKNVIHVHQECFFNPDYSLLFKAKIDSWYFDVR